MSSFWGYPYLKWFRYSTPSNLNPTKPLIFMLQVSSAPPPTIPKYPLPALEALPSSSSALRMLEAPSSFSQSPTSHNSFSRSNSRTSSPSLSDSGEVKSSSGEASDAGVGVKSGEVTESVKEERGWQEKDSQRVFLTQVYNV